MKVKGYRIQVMRSLALEGAYALPDGYIPIEFRVTESFRFIGKEMFGALMAQGMIEKIRPPSKKLREQYIFVWTITDKGMEWLERAEARPPPDRHAPTVPARPAR